jgi:segregation and condensation protein A
MTLQLLQETAAAALASPPGVDLSHVTPIRATLADALRDVQARLIRVGEARFSELVAEQAERIDVVVRFLALLELYRDGKVDLTQAELFGDIRVRWQGARFDHDAPRPAAPEPETTTTGGYG